MKRQSKKQFRLRSREWPAMLSILRRKWLTYVASVAIFLVIAATAGVALFFSPWLTRYIESDAFRKAMENETAKGLHFPSGHYAPIRRTGFWMAQSESFQASGGEKAMKSIETRGITAKLDPWAVFVRSWQLDEGHVQSGEVDPDLRAQT